MEPNGPPSRRGNDLGPVGQRVAANARALRRESDLTTREMSRILREEVGRPIVASGITKIESGAETVADRSAAPRRVDADDLVALAVVLDVSPVRLLLGPTADREPMTLVGDLLVTEDRAWEWAVGARPLDMGPAPLQDPMGLDRRKLREFRRQNRPHESPGRTVAELRALRDEHGEELQAIITAIGAVLRRGVPFDAVVEYVDFAIRQQRGREGES